MGSWIYSYWRPDLDFTSLCKNLSDSPLSSRTEKNCCSWGKNVAFAFKHLHLPCAVSQACQFWSFSVCYQPFPGIVVLEAWLTVMHLFWDGSVILKKLKLLFILVLYALMPKSLRYRSSFKLVIYNFITKLRENWICSFQKVSSTIFISVALLDHCLIYSFCVFLDITVLFAVLLDDYKTLNI